jgi:ABC-type branched-subunit amino acid transport system substrate-binding protein
MRRTIAQFAVLLFLAGASLCSAGQDKKPYHEGGTSPLAYNGPGREDPEPADFADVPIGFFGPSTSSSLDRDATAIWEGASLAVEEANSAGGYRGKPFRLVPAWKENPWAGGAAQLIQVIYHDQVWAILGGIDGSTTHLAEQVTTKLQLTLINPAATDRTIHSANVPWMFSCVPGDPAAATLISHAIRQAGVPFVLLAATDHDSRAFVAALEAAFGADRISPALQPEFENVERATGLAAEVMKSGAKAAIVAAGARESYAVIKALRRAGFSGPIFAGPSITRITLDEWIAGVQAPVLGEIPAAFQEKFSKRYGHRADYASAHGYDAAALLIAAIRAGGLNRVKIRDAVRALSPYSGITGKIEWDNLGQNQRPVTLQVIHP